MSLFVTGDTHGLHDVGKFYQMSHEPEGTYTKDDYMVICGDFGAVWDGGWYDDGAQAYYDRLPWTTLVVDGNHENYDLLDKYPVEMWNGGKVHRISDSIIHLMRGQIYDIEGFKCFVMGGARSHDIMYRHTGRSWWPREMPSKEEYEEALDNIDELPEAKVDFIFTHCASKRTMAKISPYYENDELTSFLNVIEDLIGFEHWFFGHYHVDDRLDDKHTALFNEIVYLGNNFGK